jgi:ferredoxin
MYSSKDQRVLRTKSAENERGNLVTDTMAGASTNTFDVLYNRLSAFGLMPLGITTEAGRAIALIGHEGSSIWPHFTAWRKAQPSDIADPLDTWSKSVIAPIAEQFGGKAVCPSDRPYFPFQQWAMQATGMRASPLGILIHPVYGLWHAFRGAIIFDAETLIQEPQKLSHPCDLCAGKPCLSACPVGAFSREGYDVAACRTHLASGAGEACMGGGCLARRACPVGQEYAYDTAQMQFHMRAFAG